MASGKQFYAFSILYRKRDNHNHTFTHVGVAVASSAEEVQEQAREEAARLVSMLPDGPHMEWAGISVRHVDSRTLEQAAVEVLGLDIQADLDAGSAG